MEEILFNLLLLTQFFEKLSYFVTPEDSLPCSQKHITWPFHFTPFRPVSLTP